MTISSKVVDDLIFRYTHLPIAGKRVRTPYWTDKLKKKIWGPFGGKGSPEELVEATLAAAKRQSVDLTKFSPQEIRTFMEKNRIGVDCSGLAFKLLDTLDREKGGNGLEDEIPEVRGKYLIRASVEMLTNNKVSMPVKRISDLQVGDIIKLYGGKHMAVIVKVKKNKNGRIGEIVYVHSSAITVQDGVHKARVKINQEDKGLEVQDWLEKTKTGENYGKKFFQPKKGDGIRRLRIWV